MMIDNSSLLDVDPLTSPLPTTDEMAAELGLPTRQQIASRTAKDKLAIQRAKKQMIAYASQADTLELVASQMGDAIARIEELGQPEKHLALKMQFEVCLTAA